MTYRKFKADYLFTGEETADPDSVLITTPEGIVQDIIPAEAAGSDVTYYPGWLTPGFVNCHCHLELSHLRGVLAERTGLVDFLASVIRRWHPAGSGAAGKAHVETIGRAAAAAEEEMLAGGIVACGDICNTTDTLPVKSAGRMHYHNFIETMGFVEAGAPARWAASKAVLDTFETVSPGRNSIVPHAPYSVSSALLRLTADFPGNRLLTIHNQETEAENEFYLTGKGDLLRLYEVLGLDVSFFKGTGKRSLESILPFFHENQRLILVHNVATTKADLANIRALKGPALYLCLCPNANLYISGQLPDVELLRQSGIPLVLGTDSLASNHQLDLVAEMKTLQQYFPQLETATLLNWATAGGAKALGVDTALGRFAKGTRPGVVSIADTADGRLTKASRAQRLL
ncbi:MAG TPA: amidohydrolase family protein [Puia sp.]|nr:amidohydrolase family protein [Puia sp.]